MSAVGIYIHIPFCTQKCPYCDFYSVVGDDRLMDDYLLAVLAEIERAPSVKADSLYFGGGTPILFGAKRLISLLQACQKKFDLQGEITLEANPNVTTLETLQALKKAGFNRVSFGMQSADEQELAALGRAHTVAQVTEAVGYAVSAGFSDISVDLMIGTPYQTTTSLCRSIDFLAQLPITHLSAYLLKVEPQTPYYKADILRYLPDEDTVSDSYLEAVERLRKHGFLQYEISNFAKQGFASKHNLKYWKQQAYLGFGVAASGFFAGKRYTHPRDLQGYLAAQGDTIVVEEAEVDTVEETVLLGLRLTAGIDLADLPNSSTNQPLQKRLALYEQAGLMTRENTRIALTPTGFLLSNSIIAELLARLTL